MPTPGNKRTIAIDADITGFESAKDATDAHRRIMKHYSSPLLVGPPQSDDLLELIVHIYTEDEADLVQHLKPLRPRTAARVAGVVW